MRFKLAFFSLVFAVLVPALTRAVEIPFEFRDGLIWVKLTTPTGQPLNFVLDSGAGSSVLDLQTARRLGIQTGAAQSVQTVGAQVTAYRVSNFAAQLATIPVGKTILAMDLSAASAACSQRIHGLLGQDFFRGRIVQIDFKARQIRVLQNADAIASGEVLPLKFRGDAMCVPVSVDGSKPQWTRLDTGCDDALHWVAGNLKPGRSPRASVGLVQSASNPVRAFVQLGAERLENVRTAVHERPIFTGEAGLLGNGILSKYRVTIDAVAKRVLLEKP